MWVWQEAGKLLNHIFYLLQHLNAFSHVQPHCWAVLNFREWHLSSKSWSTRLLPKITTVQGYFSYNSSGSWLSLLLINCLHITLGWGNWSWRWTPPKSTFKGSLGRKSCIYFTEEANIWSLSIALLPLFYLRWNSVWLWVVFTKPAFFFFNFPWQFTPREIRNHPNFGESQMKRFLEVMKCCHVVNCNLPKNVIS